MEIIKKLTAKLEIYNDGTLSHEVARNLRIIILAILVGQICFNATGGSAFTGYIKKLGAADFMLGILMSMPYVVRVMQLAASYILERTGKRKLLMCALGLISRLIWVPIALVPMFIPMDHAMLRVWCILIFYVLSAFTGTFIDSTFFSLCADVVPMRIRGRFFSFRSKLSMVFSMMAGLLVSYLLDHITGSDGLLGYIICFTLAGIFGAGDIFCFLFMRFPPMEKQEKTRQSLPSMVLEVLHNRSFMRLVIYWTIWGFSVNIVAPYFNVYMLGHLGMSYMEITLLCTISANICSFLFVQRWGRMMDSYGYKAVIMICATVGSIQPLIWLFTAPGSYAIPVLIVQMVTGTVWPAIDLSAQNTIMNASPARNRSMYTAVYMVVSQLCGIAVGFVAGGFLLDNVFMPFANQATAAGYTFLNFPITQYHYLMVLSFALRLAAVQVGMRFSGLESDVSTISVLHEIRINIVKTLRRRLAIARALKWRRKVRREENLLDKDPE